MPIGSAITWEAKNTKQQNVLTKITKQLMQNETVVKEKKHAMCLQLQTAKKVSQCNILH